MKLLNVVGFDPSMNNWGMAFGKYCLTANQLTLNHLDIVQPVKPTGKTVRTSSKDLIGAEQLSAGVLAAINQADAIFVEVPVGSQSASAMKGYGICIGILAMLRASGTPFFEVTPNDVKLAGPGKKNASKREMIEWAYYRYPITAWPFQTKKGKQIIIESKAEHMADAVAAIHAGVCLPEFKRFSALLSAASQPGTLLCK
ncbi:hypothetical protein [Vreelandella venusta]|uniref:hypothetical protein n=1 Tax=Vreelandella venusta TaxID=44935 RepID=UPI001168C064|nr:hypothetical protein [Halomonas venusta]GEK52343.1 hypothetical protein HVE01_30640 [Halomonas venusta]